MAEEIVIQKYSDVRSQKIDWLWFPYIAYGKITLLQGDPGDGKSTFILQLAALLTTGKKLPDGTKGKKPINVIYQCNEDDPSDTIKPRLVKAKADCEKVLFFGNDQSLTIDDNRLDGAIQEADAKLVIFDPIQSFLPQNSDMASAGKMRSILNKLSTIAQKRKCAIILVGHLNKSSSGKDMYRLLGSIDIAAIARSILLISRDEEDPSIRYMSQIKNNIGYEGPSISFSFSLKGFEWGNVVYRELPSQALDNNLPLEKAKGVILAALRNGDASSRDLFQQMEGMEISDSTIRRALKAVGAKNRKKGTNWYWYLPGKDKE